MPHRPSKSAPGRQQGTMVDDGQPLRKEQMTRFGDKTGHVVFVEQEQRFKWQKALDKPDVMYTLPSTINPQAVAFGTSTRNDWEATRINKKDTYNPNAGPGSYRVKDEHRVLSTVRNIRGGKFAQSIRPSMDMKTLGPGPAYDLSGLFKNGKPGQIPVSFNKDQRKPLSDNLTSRTDAMYAPKLPPTRFTTFGKPSGNKAFSMKTPVPGPIYDLSSLGFKTGPRFSFGMSRAPRFRADNMP